MLLILSVLLTIFRGIAGGADFAAVGVGRDDPLLTGARVVLAGAWAGGGAFGFGG
jgi:hypothetical protein